MQLRNDMCKASPQCASIGKLAVRAHGSGFDKKVLYGTYPWSDRCMIRCACLLVSLQSVHVRAGQGKPMFWKPSRTVSTFS